MKSILLSLMTFALLAAGGCTGTKNPDDPSEVKPGQKHIDMPTIIIQTTRGDIHVVLFPVSREIKKQKRHFVYFHSSVIKGYFDKCTIIPTFGPRRFFEKLIFRSNDSRLSGKYVPTTLAGTVQPVRGTLYMELTEQKEGVYADAGIFVILRKGTRESGYPELLLPSAGMVLCIGQVSKGLDILDEIKPNDTIISITRGPDYKVSVEKLGKLGRGISNLGDVLETE